MCKRLGVDVEEAIDQRPRGFLTVALENLDVCGKWRHTEDYSAHLGQGRWQRGSREVHEYVLAYQSCMSTGIRNGSAMLL